MTAAHGAAMAVAALVARAQATWTLPCDGCGDETATPEWCSHGRVLCDECRDHRPCHHCQSEKSPR